MVATQNVDTLGAIWTFSHRAVLAFVASSLDVNGCVLSYFDGTANLQCQYKLYTDYFVAKYNFFSVVS